MEKLIKKLQEKIIPVAGKISSNRFLMSLNETFQLLIPIILIGSFACLFAFIDIKPWQDFIARFQLQMVFFKVQALTINLIALYVSFILAYRLAVRYRLDGLSAGVISLLAFLILTPQELGISIPTEWLGYPGMFTALIVAFLVPNILLFCKEKKLFIKMPEGVPPIVGQAFSSLIPAAIVVILTSVVSALLAGTQYGSLHQIVYTFIQQPLKGVGLSLPGYLLIVTISMLFMFIGIHGTVIMGLIMPLTLTASAENLAAFQAGLPLPNIFTSSFLIMPVPGGMGATLGLSIMLMFLAKSKRLKTLGRIAIVPAIFNINEPVLFGIPLILNPLMFIPYILAPIAGTLISWGAMALGFSSRLTGVEVNWTIPQVISGFLAGGFSVAVTQIVVIIVTALIWYPFFKIADKNACDEESGERSLNEIS